MASPVNAIRWGLRYIRDRYGRTPPAPRNWYEQGGWLPAGRSLVCNDTGRPISVIQPRQEDR